jgi:hypothetical protein
MWPILSIADKPPFWVADTIILEQEHPATTAAFAAKSVPFALLHDGGGQYWLLNLETSQAQLIASDREASVNDDLVMAGWWSQDKIVVFYFSYSNRDEMHRVNPLKPSHPEVIPANFRSAPLRLAKWLDEPGVLVD